MRNVEKLLQDKDAVIEDRAGIFLEGHMKNVTFEELSIEFLCKQGWQEYLADVPVPFLQNGDDSITVVTIGRDMAFVLGIYPNYEYRENYLRFMRENLVEDFYRLLLHEGLEAAEKRDFDYAAIMFRAAMIIAPTIVDPVYCYGRAAMDMYSKGGSHKFISTFKIEALNAFEQTTMMEPDYGPAYYFLGFSYLNMGLYLKAVLSFKEYMRLSDNEKGKEEIQEYLQKLETPVEVELGYNKILTGSFEAGIAILEKYLDNPQINMWWPLYYYLAIGKKEMGSCQEAISLAHRGIDIFPSSLHLNNLLADLYEEMGNTEKMKKYRDKAQLISDSFSGETEEEAVIGADIGTMLGYEPSNDEIIH